MDENEIISDYLSPLLGDLMNRSLDTFIEMKESGGIQKDDENLEFYKTFSKEAYEYFLSVNDIKKCEISQDLMKYLDNL